MLHIQHELVHTIDQVHGPIRGGVLRFNAKTRSHQGRKEGNRLDSICRERTQRTQKVGRVIPCLDRDISANQRLSTVQVFALPAFFRV